MGIKGINCADPVIPDPLTGWGYEIKIENNDGACSF